MRLCVVLLDMLKLCGVLESRTVPVQVAQPFVQRWVARSDVSDIAFEMLHVDWIEPDDRGKESHIRLGDLVTPVVRAR